MLERLQEKEIIAEIKQKRSDAWVVLVDAYSSKLNQRIGVFFANNGVTNRITREVFIQAARNINRLKPNDSLWCFLWKIATEQIKKEYKKDIYQTKVTRAIQELFPDKDKISSFKPLEQVNPTNTESLAQIIRFVISSLDSRQQSILLGRFLDAMTTRHLSKEVYLHSEELRKAQEVSIKNFYIEFKNLTDIEIIPTYSQNGSLDVLTLLIKLLKPNDARQEDLNIEKLLESSLQELNKKTDSNHFNITLEKTSKISILVILVVILAITLVFMTNKTSKSKSQNLDILKRTSNSSKKNENINKPEDTKHSKIQSKQARTNQQDVEIKESFARISELAQNNDIDGLIEILNTGIMVDKMIAAGFLATVGDASAIEPLKRESVRWTGKEDTNIFKTAIERINNRIKPTRFNAQPNTKDISDKRTSHASTIKGIVTDSHGNAIEDAKVLIFTHNKKNSANNYTLTATTYSHKEGAFEIDSLSDLKDANIVLLVIHPSYGFFYKRINPKDSPNILVKLPPSSEFVCDIVDQYDNQIVNANMSIQVVVGNETLPSTLIDAIGICNYTQDDGTFDVLNLPDGCNLNIQLQCTGYKDQSFNQKISGPVTHISVTLEEESQIQCYLVDTYGTEVTGFVKLGDSETIKSDHHGHLKIDFDSAKIIAGFAYDTDKKVGASFVLRDEDIINSDGIEIILRDGIRLSGRVVDSNGNAIEDARFRIIFKTPYNDIITSPWDLWLKNYDRQDGSFSLEGVPLGLPIELYIESSIASKATEIQGIKTDEINDLGNIELRTY